MSAAPSPAEVGPSPGFWHRVRTALGIGAPLDWAFKQLCQLSGVLVILFVFLIVVLLAVQAWPALRTLGLSVLTDAVWKPNPADRNDPADVGQLGGLTFVYGSVVTALLAMLIAVPLGVGTAAFLS